FIERKVAVHARNIVFATSSAEEDLRNRYPEAETDQWMTIPNGYDETVFSEVEQHAISSEKSVSTGGITLVHSGILYPDERDPECLFLALSRLKKRGEVDEGSLKIVLRATGHDEFVNRLLDTHGISDLVSVESPISYREALTEMLSADGLLLLQAANCNRQVPAKLYEYFRAQRPIFALTDQHGDTAKTLREAGLSTIAPLDDANAIEVKLRSFLKRLSDHDEPVCALETARRFSRKEQTKLLADILDRLV
ncbi:MAG: hypothetical protein MI867_00920, partial [Pseudomonadales bacterium]|nr:hypothetical protein [Pseudomonadales bacterium]